MRIRRVRVLGFRGVMTADLLVSRATALVGANGCGKSTIVDAVSLALGRPKMVRQLTEHDFTGSCPGPASRLRVLVTLVGFPTEDPEAHDEWFRMGRAVAKWIDTGGTEHASLTKGSELCVTIGFAARFDHDTLEVETLRYFHHDDTMDDPFAHEGSVDLVPQKLIADIGYFVLPARRTWDAVASFNSDLFRRTVVSSSGIPASTILAQRDHLREPQSKVEEAPELLTLTESINGQLSRLMLRAPKFQLRVTAGDSEAVLQALLPHYVTDAGPSLPAHRHGTGLVSLQTLLLLLEVGRSRRKNGQSFILALEEPELHLAPGIESRLVAEALRLADQVVCTTHSPEVARLFDPTATLVVSNEGATAVGRPLLTTPLTAASKAWERKFYGVSRARVVSALMHPVVLVPEGRLDTDWLARIASLGDRELTQVPPFACVYGLAPTEDAKVAETVERVGQLRNRVIALVDGDKAGDDYAKSLLSLPSPPSAVVQWPANWAIEDVVRWIMDPGGTPLLTTLQGELSHVTFASLDALRDLLRTENNQKTGTIGLKQDHVCHEVIIATLEHESAVRARAAEVCEALVRVALGNTTGCARLKQVNGAGTTPPHYAFVP
ncbi:MAG: ATP-dependent nuclease [Polyangiaceae bacterium]